MERLQHVRRDGKRGQRGLEGSPPRRRGFVMPDGLVSLDTSRSWKKIYDNYTAFQREQELWFRVCENTYDNYMATAGSAPAAAPAAAPAKKS